MKNTKILEMLRAGQIEELKMALSDEIYQEVLSNKAGSKQRYAAMKKYFGYIKTARESLQKPCLIEFEGKDYISFCNSHSIALTTEPCGTIELFTDVDRYPDVSRLIHFEGVERQVDFGKIFADAKSKGYKLKKDEVNHKCKYLLEYDGLYFRLGLLDATFSIINDGEVATVYNNSEDGTPITIKTSIGVCVIMPVRIEDTDEFIVINYQAEGSVQ